VHAMHPSDQKGWSQDAAIPRPHLRVGSGGMAVLLEIPAYLRPSKGMQIFFPLFLCPQLLRLGLLSLTAAQDLATLLSLLCFSLLYSTRVLYVLVFFCCYLKVFESNRGNILQIPVFQLGSCI